MKLYNHLRAFGAQASMREAKANKKEAVWSIFTSNNVNSKKAKAKAPKFIALEKKKGFCKR